MSESKGGRFALDASEHCGLSWWFDSVLVARVLAKMSCVTSEDVSWPDCMYIHRRLAEGRAGRKRWKGREGREAEKYGSQMPKNSVTR